ncbi:NUDIX hydrolase domain-like protein [Blastocladiella britannica]|nr:NUDIX hydrolase domain-like protein [Blastocladiella britannica]
MKHSKAVHGAVVTATTSTTTHSLLDLITQCNNVPHDLERWLHNLNLTLTDASGPGYAFLNVDGVRVGILTPLVAAKLAADESHAFSLDAPTAAWSVPTLELLNPQNNDGSETLSATQICDVRSGWIAAVVAKWRAEDAFPALRGWRDELYPVYGAGGSVVFTIERAASGLFGVRTFGCHMTAYTLDEGVSHPHTSLHVWLARRSLKKPTFPGMIDNTAAGGLPAYQSPRDCIVREAHEEATISEKYATQHVVSGGAVSYFQLQEHLESLGGIAGAETQFVYDLQVARDFVPRVNDGEVLGFTKLSVSDVMQVLRSGQFKPNCAVVMIDFLVRHGYVTAENEPDFLAIVNGMRRPLEWDFAGPGNGSWRT